ncbi:MAG: zinc ABC transporter solute-binding protein [Rhodobacteraceae bacterium]|nr:zinc ABC transporter solute-binding protein [Paracoccaceae bacterium]
MTARITKRALFRAAGAAAALAVLPQGIAAAGRLSVVATTGMIADTARRIGGDVVDVRALMAPGVDPHAYRQTRSDIVAMVRADQVLAHGLYLEAQMENFLEDLGRRRNVARVGEAVPEDLLLGHESYADKFDPHVWMDPVRWSLVAMRIRDVLSAARPDDAALFAGNTDSFLGELTVLRDYSETVLATVPETRRVLLTAHDAFRYFGAAYGFEVLGIQGISTESEAGLNRIGVLVDTIVARDIGAVFVESSVSDRNIRALIEGAAARGQKTTIGGELFSDAMGPEGTYEGTYLGMIDHNVTTIAAALGGSVPPRGMSGRLSAGI